MKQLSFLFLLLILLVTSCSAQPDITGKWYGRPDVGGFSMRLTFDISQSDNGYTATMESPDQTAEKIPVTSVTFENNAVNIQIAPIDFAYKGELNKEGIIKGSFTQGGQTFTLDLSRREPEPIERSQTPGQTDAYHTEEVSFMNEKAGIRLAGTLTLPKSSTSFTAVVLVSGSGPQNRDEEIMGHKPFLVLADYLTQRGIAVLRYDDRGVGQSEGDYAKATLDDFASDAQAAVEYLKTRKEINKEKIGIVGHSEGGGIAFKLASEKVPAFIVTMAGVGVDGFSLLRMQRKALFTASNIPEEYINQYNDYMDQAQRLAVEATSFFQLRDGITQLFTGTYMEKQIDPAVKQLSSPEIVSFLKYDPSPYFKKISCPILALNGMNDLQVPCSENLSAILEGLSTNKEVTTKPYFGLNHLFQTSNSGLPAEYAQIEETINPEVLKDIADWLLKR
ncbi:pimeloyl-ACP methyl ester carboxylesterase [Parabacteroides sp. PF5-5]|uniref:alpha/beta hydrolase family protein n=1 Tax=unclassified Parabacteroides TaxID=2649774 RepID=UPI002476C13B|nr:MULTISPECIES: alpha/beta fold hydrolase [unclassified Parabacteroides]MDH6305394.1 pimeloyl-ACP methyl ester carboxylesterase [Parabacteroides sp. PH5-39]MDH6316104.1 pimeloyl-ACP methyl ester carboxylesterase [Parabacteroides sp. PF5-13]MDH6320254.1 pimeloyl-ACP methyl ester carboxylesterase [Parabacteroides sp. PH5-13]MDH6323984.1 pimeloyl-ACP methyl ester carboxylesterase [Parabacteroides sp. PH5-8]MDH6327295.1 pimeloyl-ACP methyl ester carboxylesterase [Parabacteroides sp. PH5-41]